MTDDNHPQYPENLPVNFTPPEKFTFSLRAGAENRLDISQRISALEERIDNLVKRVIIEDGPLMVPILRITQDPADLTLLGEALVKAAPLVEELNRYKAQQSVFDLAEKEPGFFMWAFGEFSGEFDDLDFLDGAPPPPSKKLKEL